MMCQKERELQPPLKIRKPKIKANTLIFKIRFSVFFHSLSIIRILIRTYNPQITSAPGQHLALLVDVVSIYIVQ